MRGTLFQIFVNIFQSIISALQVITDECLNLLVNTCNFFIELLANIFRGILWLIDRDRMHHAEQAAEQSAISTELSILMNVSAIKEDALKREKWTGEHSQAIAELSQELYDQCDWEEQKIHNYMKSVVESIPGLSYVSGDEDDDEDDDSIKL